MPSICVEDESPTQEHAGQAPFHALAATSDLRVRLVRTADQMNKVVEFRRKAYARFPSQDALMSKIEDADLDSSAVLVIAENVASEEVLGTMRVHCGSDYVLRRFPDLSLPDKLKTERLCFVTRLAVSAPDVKLHAFVRALLFKACYQISVAAQTTEMLVVIHPRRTWQFRQLTFRSLSNDNTPVRLAALGYEPLVAMAANVSEYGQRLSEINSPLYEFTFSTFHPEIEVFQSISTVESRVRLDRSVPAQFLRKRVEESSANVANAV